MESMAKTARRDSSVNAIGVAVILLQLLAFAWTSSAPIAHAQYLKDSRDIEEVYQ